jgi:protein-ribulosamine 3-kinase
LELIEKAASGLAPVVFRLGTIVSKEDNDDIDEEPQERPFMISEYKFLQALRSAHALALAKRLALELHAYKSERGQEFISFMDPLIHY